MKAPLVTYQPDERLARFIDGYWRINGPIGVPGVHLLPHYYTELVINFGSPHLVASENNRSLKTIWFNGQKSRPTKITGIEFLDFMVVRFKPVGARIFFDLPQIEWADRIIDAEPQILRSGTLRDQLGAAASDLERVRILNEFFLGLLREKNPGNSRATALVTDAVAFIHRREGKVNVHRLAERYGVSYRQLLRYFQDSVGVTPRMLARIHAFEQAALQLTFGESLSLVRLAVDQEYFDQPHFNRSFKEFSGVTPLQFLETVRKAGPMPPGIFPLLMPVVSPQNISPQHK